MSRDEHLSDVPAGAGCTEIWEHLSERRAEEAEEETNRTGDCGEETAAGAASND